MEPLIAEGSCIGCVGFDFVEQQRLFSESESRLLGLIGATLSNALERKRSDESLRELERQLRQRIWLSSLALR